MEAVATQNWPTGEEVCRALRERIGPRVMLGFSAGKDAVGAALQLRKFFEDVKFVYREIIPGLGFVERALTYYESFFKTPILRVPGEVWFQYLDDATFMDRTTTRLVDEIEMYRGISAGDVADAACVELGVDPATAWWADGYRRGDTMARAIKLKQSGPVDEKLRVFSPIYDWSHARLADELVKAGCKLATDYRLFGRSFDALRGRFLAPIADHYPDDYKKILRVFPMAHLELRRLRGETR